MEKNKVFSGLFWKFAERIGAQGVSLVVSIILARILSPSDYGTIALITIFITISNVFIESGMGTALIQKKDADQLDFSSVFYFNIIISIIMYIILFCCAPLISKFYNNELLISIVRILGITLIISGVKSIQNAYISKKMIFKKFFISTLVGTIISAVVGIIMAYAGFGVWALVTQQLLNNFIDTIMLWFTTKWKPSLEFSIERVRVLFSFGWKMLCSGLIDSIYNELYGLTIGKFFKSESLAYYNRANQFPKLIVINIDGSIQSVMLPTLSAEQENKVKVKNIMRKSIKTSAFIIFPLLFGLAAVSKSLVKIILTDKWLPCVPLLQMLCFSYALWPVHTVNLQAISAMGRSDIFLRLEIIKKIIGIVALIISIPFGITAMVSMKIVTSIISSMLNAYPNKKLLNYSYIEQIKDILPMIIISSIMAILVNYIGIIDFNIYVKMIVQIFSGMVIYVCLAKVFKIDVMDYLLIQIKNFLKQKTNRC